MRIVQVFSIIILFTCCKENQLAHKKSETLIPFKALVGSWERLNDEEGNKTYEIWKMKNPALFIGEGFTLQGRDTVFKEALKIFSQNDGWTLEVSGVHEIPILFSIDQFDEESFICANDKNPFPKRIEYHIKGSKLQAVISGERDKILFDFKRLN